MRESRDPASRSAREALVHLSAAQAARDEAELKDALAGAAAAAGPQAVEEVLLQSYLFLGFPAAIWAFGIWRSSGSRTAGERAEPVTPQSAPQGAAECERAGQNVCGRVYGTHYEKLRNNVRHLHPELDRWMIREGYGKVLARPVLDLPTRELCIVAPLAVTRWEPQLHSHLLGALNVGADPAEVEAALEEGLSFSSDAAWTRCARDLWSRVMSRHAG